MATNTLKIIKPRKSSEHLVRYTTTLHKLSRQSTNKHTDAYLDIDWDAEENQIDIHDPIWLSSGVNFLAETEWFQSLPKRTQSELALELIANQLKTAISFENTLQQGFLAMLAKMDNNNPEFRYCHHEIIEESHHSMMFQEFINRTGLDPQLEWFKAFFAKDIITFGRHRPEIFFSFVLSGEEPLDVIQRHVLKFDKTKVHPLYRKIIETHVIEEARHICFARAYLEKNVPKMSLWNKIRMAVYTPITFYFTNRYYFLPTAKTRKRFAIPRKVIQEAYFKNPEFKAYTIESMKVIRSTFQKIGLLNSKSYWLWKILGLAK